MKTWIAFDAAGTLFEPAEPVEKIYADCFSSLGFGIPESSWKVAIAKAFAITPDPIYQGTGAGEVVEKGWWRDLVRNAVLTTEIRPDVETMSDAFEELFEYYSFGSAWRAFPETEAVLRSMKSKDVCLGVVSNFDSRIHRVMEELKLRDYFDFVITSADVSARKPSPRILERFMEKAAVKREGCCLVGDSPEADGGAARAAGIEFFQLNRPAQGLSNFEQWHEERFL